MLKNRLLVVFVVAALLTLAVLLGSQSIRTARVVASAQNLPTISSGSDPAAMCPFTPAELRSIHPVWVKEIGQWVMYSNHGPVGVDGGMLTVRNCLPLR